MSECLYDMLKLRGNRKKYMTFAWTRIRIVPVPEKAQFWLFYGVFEDMGKFSGEGFFRRLAGKVPDMDAEMKRRVIMTITGVSISGVSVGLFSASGMGFDPFQVFAHGTWAEFDTISGHPFSYGVYYMFLSLIMFIAVAAVNRKLMGLGTLFNLFLVGYIADFSGFVCRQLFPEPGLVKRLILLFSGIVIMCLSSALYYVADLGVSVYDAVALTITEKERKVSFRWCRIACDLVCVLIGFHFGAAVGLGTIVTAFFMGPLIDVFRRTVAEPMLYGKGAAADRVLKRQAA